MLKVETHKPFELQVEQVPHGVFKRVFFGRMCKLCWRALMLESKFSIFFI
jgi:hypothetical protein